MEETELDIAHRAMAEAPENGVARLGFYAKLCNCELFLLLEREAEGDEISPGVFDLGDGPVLLAFDNEERLAAFAEGPVPYAALPGRLLAQLLQGAGIGLGVNLGVARSSTLLPADAVDWLATMVERAPEPVRERPVSVAPPSGVPQALLTSLEGTLAGVVGLAAGAWLAAAAYADGREAHVLAFEAAAPGAKMALSQAAAEAVAFSGLDDGGLDVTFLPAGDPVVPQLARVGFRFDLEPVVTSEPERRPRAPGTDPKRPPILR